jgi:hypothetical protein
MIDTTSAKRGEMNLSSGVSLGQLLLALGVLLLSGGVAWGGILQRVKTLEKEVEALSGFAEGLARIDERTVRMATDITTIMNSWLLKEPAGYDSPKGKGR